MFWGTYQDHNKNDKTIDMKPGCIVLTQHVAFFHPYTILLYSWPAVTRSNPSNCTIELPRITTWPKNCPSVCSASSMTTLRKASYPRSVPTTVRLPLRLTFNRFSCSSVGRRREEEEEGERHHRQGCSQHPTVTLDTSRAYYNAPWNVWDPGLFGILEPFSKRVVAKRARKALLIQPKIRQATGGIGMLEAKLSRKTVLLRKWRAAVVSSPGGRDDIWGGQIWGRMQNLELQWGCVSHVSFLASKKWNTDPWFLHRETCVQLGKQTCLCTQ